VSGPFASETADTPLVSVIVPAYRAQDTIGAALSSVLACGLDLSVVEVVIASDDGADYAAMVPEGLRATHIPPGPVASGPGAARNRALDAAKGEWNTFLDADDSWDPGYLAALKTSAGQGPLAVSPTAVMVGGREILSLPGSDSIDHAAMARSGASFIPFVRRAYGGRFTSHLAEDVLHTAEILSRCGGSAPVSDVPYRVTVRSGSVSNRENVPDHYDAAYGRLIALVERGETGVAVAARSAVADLFRAKRRLNDQFRRQTEFETYYEFVADMLAREATGSGGRAADVRGAAIKDTRLAGP